MESTPVLGNSRGNSLDACLIPRRARGFVPKTSRATARVGAALAAAIMEASMALASASGLGRPSVARLGGRRPLTAAFASDRRRVCSRASAADGAPASRATEDAPASAPFPTRRARAGTAGIRRARAATAGARRGTYARPRAFASRIVPVASDALPDRTHPSHRLAPDTRRDPASFTDAYRKKPAALLVGYAGGSFRGNTVNHELPRGSTVDDALEDALFAAGGSKPPTTEAARWRV